MGYSSVHRDLHFFKSFENGFVIEVLVYISMCVLLKGHPVPVLQSD